MIANLWYNMDTMKTKVAIFLFGLYSIAPAWGSDCIGADCQIGDMNYQTVVSAPAQMGTVVDAPRATTNTVRNFTVAAIPQYSEPVKYVSHAVPMRSVKTLSVKPVEHDDRMALWDGTQGNYKSRRYDKTVDWKSGVPIWDDSISHYQKRDFYDWYLEDMPEIYAEEVKGTTSDTDLVEMYNQNMADAAATRARIEELLAPTRPSDNLWVDAPVRAKYTAQDMSNLICDAFGDADVVYDDGCPFETDAECDIWRKKPIVRETVSPRSPKIRDGLVNEFIDAAMYNPDIRANDPAAAALLGRYKLLMQSANACCTDGMVYSLKRAGASDGLVYKFMSDDANFYGFGARCLMMTDGELDEKYPNTSIASVAADVRNGCLCRGRQWFGAMLAPFKDIYDQYPEFANQRFYYNYTDGLGRNVTVSVNDDVKNVLAQLERCP